MPIYTDTLSLSTKGFYDIQDVTPAVTRMIESHHFIAGTCLVFVPGSTASITTIEFEPGLVQDMQELVDRLFPAGRPYHHDARWGDGNGFSHVRSAVLGPGITVPVADGQLLLGTWQQIVLIDFDNRPRHRSVVVQLQGVCSHQERGEND